MLAITVLCSVASISGLQGASQDSRAAQETEGDGSLVVSIAGASVTVTADGTPVILVRGPNRPEWVNHELGHALGNEGILVSNRAPLLIDDNGIAWTGHGGRLVGYRGDRVIHEYSKELYVNWGNAAVDVHGRVWFAAGQQIVWFDGVGWHERSSPFAREDQNSSPLRVSPSSDGSHIYVWQEKATAFLDISGEDPYFVLVDQSRGLRDKAIWSLTPVGRSSVLTQPSYTTLSAGQWLGSQRSGTKPPHEKFESRIIGSLELAHHPSLVQSECESPYVHAPRALDWSEHPDLAELRNEELRSDPALARPLIPHGESVRFRVTERSGLRRLSPAQERFGATYVDRMDRHWRVDDLHRLSRLDGARAFMLVDRETREPVPVQQRFRSDKAGRVYIGTMGNGQLVWLPPKVASKSSSSTASDFAWQEVDNHPWTSLDEERALGALHTGIDRKSIEGLVVVARIFQRQINAGAPFSHPHVWREVASQGWQFARRPEESHDLAWAHIAHAVGLRDQTEAFLEEGLINLPGRSAKDRSEARLKLCRFANTHGFDDLALRAYDLCAKDPAISKTTLTGVLQSAAHLSVRCRRYELAIQRYDEVIPLLIDGWVRDDAIEARALVKTLLTAKDDPDANIAFINAYFKRGRQARGKADAWRYLLTEYDLNGTQQRHAHQDLLRIALQEGDPDEAYTRALAIAATPEVSPGACAMALIEVARYRASREDLVAAERDYADIYTRYEGTTAAIDARVAVARIYLAQDEPARAVAMLELCFETSSAEAAPPHSFSGNHLYRATLHLSLAHEATGDLTAALKYARQCRSKYCFSSFCGTCSGSEAKRLSDRIRHLESSK